VINQLQNVASPNYRYFEQLVPEMNRVVLVYFVHDVYAFELKTGRTSTGKILASYWPSEETLPKYVTVSCDMHLTPEQQVARISHALLQNSCVLLLLRKLGTYFWKMNPFALCSGI